VATTVGRVPARTWHKQILHLLQGSMHDVVRQMRCLNLRYRRHRAWVAIWQMDPDDHLGLRVHIRQVHLYSTGRCRPP
jgi:hypothetical protein